MDTQNWIIEKINSYAYQGGNVKNSYYISFGIDYTSSAIMKVKWREDDSQFGPLEFVSVFKITDIDYLYYTEINNMYNLNIKLKEGKFVSTIYKKEPDTEIFDGGKLYSFELNKTFKENNLPERMKKAFARLIELNGGKHFSTKETF